MPPVPGTLQSACDGMLGKVTEELCDAESEWLCNETVDRDPVVKSSFVLDWAVVSVVMITFGNETVPSIGRLPRSELELMHTWKSDRPWLVPD